MHADHARSERIAPLEAAAAHHGYGNGCVNAFCKGEKFMIRPAAHHAAAADQKGLLRGLDHLHKLVHIVEIRLRSA